MNIEYILDRLDEIEKKQRRKGKRMKLRNKKTGEIHEITEVVPLHDMDKKFVIYSQTEGHNHAYKNLAELNAEWEDYEEPKGYWSYDTIDNDVTFNSIANEDDRKADQEIGNYFETREEAEKAVEKLKAWKRLRDKGFRFDYVTGCWIEFTLKSADSDEDYEQGQKDLHLLFGGEE